MHKSRWLVGAMVVAGAAIYTAHAQMATDPMPPIPFGTQEMIKLNAILDAAPFMTTTADRVTTLKQERLRLCVQQFGTGVESIALGRASSTDVLKTPLTHVKDSWLALCTRADQKMPILEFAMQLAEEQEKSAQARFDQGRLSSADIFDAKRDRLTAEIEMIECQQAMSRPNGK